MKRLFLVRHARAVWLSEGRDDFNRPLSPRGEKSAVRMGKALKGKKVHPGLIISSPAARALRTAEIVAAEIDYPGHRIVIDPRIYSGEGDHVLDIILNLDDAFQSAMLFGHNPAMTEVSNYLTDYGVENMHTCGIMCMDFEIDSWKKAAKGKGAYVFYDYPKDF
jgi:phosphohistidine phosphatase